jgi:outer membrane protein
MRTYHASSPTNERVMGNNAFATRGGWNRLSAAGPTLKGAVLAVGIVLLGSITARAQSIGNFEDADSNRDGRVTLQEFEAFLTKRLMTANGPVAQNFKKLSPTEQAAKLQQRFEQLDHGHKGYLDRSDWSAAESLVRERTGRRLGVPNEGLSIGGGISDVDPAYVGYHRRIDPFPLVSYRYGRFFVSGTSAGVIASENDAYSLSVLLVPQLMRLKTNASPELEGLTERQWTIDAGVRLSVTQPWGTSSLAALHDVLDRSNGTVVKLDYSYPIPVGAAHLSPGVGAAWESASQTNYYYGVTPAEALPGRPAYSPGSALNPSARLDYSVPLSGGWTFGAGVSYTHFDRSIRDSPLIDQPGSRAITVTLERAIPFSKSSPAVPSAMSPLEH